VAVVTISRQYGAGGLSVAPALADALGFRLIDRQITEEAARRMGVDPEMALSRDERAPALVEEIGMALAAGTPQFDVGRSSEVDDRILAENSRAVMESLGDAGGFVILGRGGQAALKGRPDAFHLSLVGERPDRIRRVARSRGISEKEAAARCDRVDADRAAYVRKFYGVDIRDPLLYDVVLNTTRLGVDGATDVALAAVRRKLALR